MLERQAQESGREWYERLQATHATFDEYLATARSAMRAEEKAEREAEEAAEAEAKAAGDL